MVYGIAVDWKGDASVTLRQPGAGATAKDSVPVLLLVGNAQRGGALDVARVQPIAGTLEIGRARADQDQDVAGRLGLPDRLLSRQHLRLERLPGGCDLEDLGSLNGTVLDGRQLKGRARLSEGSVVFFGGHAAVFRRVTEDALKAIDEDLTEPFGPVATTSPGMATMLWRLRRLARSGTEVLITGETGSGKEVYARAIHRASGRGGRLVAVNCAAIPAELAESELFGYARGAHSTATEAKTGLIQSAEGGTLFLDEIGDMNPRLQAKLLRFLQDREVTPLGSTSPRRVDVQVVAATNNAASTADGGELRSDLAARLGAQAIQIPPLRERTEDLGVLIHYMLAQAVKGPAPELEPTAFQALCEYGWPRNVRELQKVIVEALAVAEGAACLRLAHFPDTIASAVEASPGPSAAPGRRLAPKRAELEELLRAHEGNVAQVARVLDRQWAVVWRWLVKYEIDPARYRK
jgi:transcriptional regulator with PAS, ATPase and Fis domain